MALQGIPTIATIVVGAVVPMWHAAVAPTQTHLYMAQSYNMI